MQCSIISSGDERKFVNMKSITLPAFFGELQILPGHAEDFVALQKGQIVLEGGKVDTLPVEGGMCHIKDDFVVVIL